MTSSSSPIASSSRRVNQSTSSLFLDLDSPSRKLFAAITFIILSAAASVTRPPAFARLPRNGKTKFTYDSRENIELECKADGDPRPVYSWTKDGRTIDVLSNPLETRISIGAGGDGNHGNLKIVEPRESDQGYYQCNAKNVHGVALSQVVHLEKAFMEQMPKVTAPRVRSVGLNSHVMLTCNPPASLPKAEIFWTRGGEEDSFGSMDLTKRVTQDLEGNLHILSVQEEDDNEGKPYTCNTFNPTMRSIQQGDDQIIKIKENDISGESGPELVWGTSQLNTIAMKGQTLRLMCVFAGTPVPEVTWRKVLGNPLPKLRTKYVSYNQELVIMSVDFSDQGQYQCSATNGIGSPKTLTITVQVQSTPFFTAKPMDANRADEESYTLTCEANGNPPPSIAILRNGEELDFDKLDRGRYIQRGGKLIISNLMKDKDTAVFQCNASNIHGYAFSNTYLNVLAESPKFTEPPEKMHRVVEDSNAILKCRTFGAPKPKIKWSRGAQVLSGSRYQIQDNGDLKIVSVNHSDQGNYTCFASNKFGGISEHGELAIHKKTVIQIAPESASARIGTSAFFRCAVESDASLALSVTWFKDGERVASSRFVKVKEVIGARSHAEASVKILDVQEEHSGLYTCLASTDLDRVEAEAQLDVLDVPKPPSSPTIVRCSTRKADLSWDPSKNNGRSPILNYIMQLRAVPIDASFKSYEPDSWQNAVTDIEPGTTMAEIPLSPWANYTFRVLARNKLGVSPPSPISKVCWTGKDSPDENPEDVKGEGTSPNNLVITWKPMPPIEHNADGFYYILKYRRQNLPNTPDWEVMHIRDWTKGYLRVPNQETYVPYDIMVIAYNSVGQSKGKTVVHTGWSGEAVPRQAPANFACAEPTSPIRTRCSWDEVPRRQILGNPAGYKIQFWVLEEGETAMREVDFPFNSTSGTVSLLKPYSNIVLQIRVLNTLYESEPSERVQVTTPEGLAVHPFST